MHMVCHQHIAVDGYTELVGVVPELVEVDGVVPLCIEAGLAIIAALNDVQRHAGNMVSTRSGH